MLVTLTRREILALLPRFRIMAVSMERLQIAIARIASITIDVINLNAVIMVEAQPTRRTAPMLPFEQFGQAWTDIRMPSASRVPIHPVAIIGTAIAPDFDMPCNGYLTVREEMHGFRVRRRCGKGETGLPSMPIPLHGPRDGLHWMTPVYPAAELCPQKVIESSIDGLAHTGAVIVCPAPDDGVELTDQCALRESLRALHDASQLRQMCPSSARCAWMLALAGLIRVLNPRRRPEA
jgi:hypothetical protein